MKLSRQVPEHTKTISALWCKKDFMEMGQKYRNIRSKLRDPMDTCHWCGHKIADGEMISLACLTVGGNKVLCGTCVDELLKSDEQPNQPHP